MRNIRFKLIPVVLAGLFLLSVFIPGVVPKANAVTADDLADIGPLIAKFQQLSPAQVQDALEIGQRIIVQSDIIPDILTAEQKQRLSNLGLSNDDVKDAYACVMEQLDTEAKIEALQNGTVADLANFVNSVEGSFDPALKENLLAKGITVSDIIVTALDVAELTFDPFSNIPEGDLAEILLGDMGIAPATASRYGLSWDNVYALRSSLTDNEKNKLMDIIFTINNTLPRLSGLAVSSGTLDPVFAPKTTHYTVILDSNTGSITVTPTASGATIKVDGLEVTSGAASGNIPIDAGSKKTVTVTVTQNGAETGYFLEVIRPEKKEVTSGQPSVNVSVDTPQAIFVPQGVSNARIQANAVSQDGQKVATLPLVQVQAENSALGTIALQVPQNTRVEGPADWDGTITLPTVKTNDSVHVSNGSVSAVVEVGQPDKVLVFDRAVRLLIPGQAGKSAAYKQGNSDPVRITRTISADSQAVADDELAEGQEGKIDVGDDLVIWTRHFTEFIAYTPTGGGGGGGGVAPGVTVTPSTGGTVELSGAVKLQIPAGALQGTSPVKVLLEKDVAPPAAPAGYRLLGQVYSLSVNGQSHYTFNSPGVTLTFTFDPAALKTGEKPVVEYYDEGAGTWVNLGGNVSGNTITVTIDHFTRFAVMAAPKVSLNDIDGHWAEENIRQLVAAGAITGYPDGSFKPDNNITRAEFATVLVKAFKLASQGGKIFNDTGGHWARDYIATAASYGIIKGYDDATFGPDDLITREQMAVMAVRAAKLAVVTGGTAFMDAADISAWARDAVGTAVNEGIIKGYPDNTFKPLNNATRAEAVTVIVKTLK